MKSIKFISGLSFSIAILLMILILLELPFTVNAQLNLSYASMAFGFIGIVLNLFNVKDSKHRVSFSIVFWIATALLTVGIWWWAIDSTSILAKVILFTGIACMLIALALPKKR
jgi:hypothetical protein